MTEVYFLCDVIFLYFPIGHKYFFIDYEDGQFVQCVIRYEKFIPHRDGVRHYEVIRNYK